MSVDLVRIIGLNKVYDPGCHCAFTDITYWRGRVWLTFREALNHSVHPSSQIVVMASANHGRTFQIMGRLSKSGLDVRDPHFFIIDDRLHITIPSWRLPRERQQRVTLIASSDNGRDWNILDSIDELHGVTLWRPRIGPDGKHYAAAYDRQIDKHTGAVRLFSTSNGIDWESVSVIHDAHYPNETELCFQADGTLLALVRREDIESRHPLLASSKPPYTTWEKKSCDQFLQGPLLERLGDNRYLVIGRSPKKLATPDRHANITRIFSLDPDTGHLEPGDWLESGGDTSYAGFARIPDSATLGQNGEANALISYYSGHGFDNGSYRGDEQAQHCAIYVARARID